MVTVITGASRGIGRAIADELTARRVQVVNLSRSIPSDAAFGTIPCDVSDPEQVRHAFQVIRQFYGSPSTLICNAGHAVAPRPIVSSSVDDFERTMRTNVGGVFYPAREFLRGVEGSGWKHALVLMASTAALTPRPEWYAYAASKAGVVALGHGIAAEYPDLNVLTVAPGRTATALRQVLAPGEPPECSQPPEAVARIVADALEEMRAHTSRVYDGDPLVVRGEA